MIAQSKQDQGEKGIVSLMEKQRALFGAPALPQARSPLAAGTARQQQPSTPSSSLAMKNAAQASTTTASGATTTTTPTFTMSLAQIIGNELHYAQKQRQQQQQQQQQQQRQGKQSTPLLVGRTREQRLLFNALQRIAMNKDGSGISQIWTIKGGTGVGK